MTTKAPVKRKHCRQCGALAGITRDICASCHMAEVRGHIKSRRRPGEPDKGTVQTAHGKAIQSLELRKFAAQAATRAQPKPPLILDPDRLVAPMRAGANAGMDGQEKGLAYASMFSVAMGQTGKSVGAAMLFYSYGQKTFYRHVRAILSSLPAARLLPKRTRIRSKAGKVRNPLADSLQNQAIARALRYTRIFLQQEIIPLALKIGCGKGTIWHLESADTVIAPRWVEAYALALEVPEAGLWAFAEALTQGPAAKGCAKDMVRKFVTIVLM